LLKSLKLRVILILVFLFVSIIFLLPNVIEMQGAWKKYLPSEKIHLGLDLKGGMHLLLALDTSKLMDNMLDRKIGQLKDGMIREGIRFLALNKRGNDITVVIRAESRQKFYNLLGKELPDMKVAGTKSEGDNLMLDLAYSDKELMSLKDNAVHQALETIRNRIDQFGVSEPVIVRQGESNILVQLPGVKDPERALELIGKTAQLEFKLVDEENNAPAGLIPVPEGAEQLVYRKRNPDTGVTTTEPMLVKKQALRTGDMVTDARMAIGRGEFTSEPHVALELSGEGARIFDRITGENVGKRIAIVLDNTIYSAPVVKERISGGHAQISGAFTPDEAKDLAIVLRAGALPAPVTVVQNITIGPTLGKDSIRKGVQAALLGGFLVGAFMIFYYRASGIVADIALFLNLILLLAAFAALNATMTLPGIAGIILTIGIGVDTNVLIFERIREELRLGKTVRAAVDGGYSKAWVTIFDAHITTLITSCALHVRHRPHQGLRRDARHRHHQQPLHGGFRLKDDLRLDTGEVQTKEPEHLMKFREIVKKTSIDFISLRNKTFILSAVLVGLGLFGLLMVSLGRANLSVDFTGGTEIQIRFDRHVPIGDLRKALASGGISDVQIQEVAGRNDFILKTKLMDAGSMKIQDRVSSIVASKLPGRGFQILSSNMVGSSVGKTLKKHAIIAIVLSLLGIIIYIAWRFDFVFGIAACIATFHDVLAMLGIFYVLGLEMDILFITALLTIAGYSLTDTVVVFDRIRENMAKMKSRSDIGETINVSINEVLSRTIVTSLTTLLVIAALLVLGGHVLFDFSLALFVGVIVGTYSSVFVASPLIFLWRTKV
jgi:SecD/SecF fusion protein